MENEKDREREREREERGLASAFLELHTMMKAALDQTKMTCERGKGKRKNEEKSREERAGTRKKRRNQTDMGNSDAREIILRREEERASG